MRRKFHSQLLFSYSDHEVALKSNSRHVPFQIGSARKGDEWVFKEIPRQEQQQKRSKPVNRDEGVLDFYLFKRKEIQQKRLLDI